MSADRLPGSGGVRVGSSGFVWFDYAALSDEEAEFGRAETVRKKGFYIFLCTMNQQAVSPVANR